MNHTTNQSQHYHIHIGDPDELEDNDDLALESPKYESLDAVLTTTVDYLNKQRKLVASEHVVDLTTYRGIRDSLNLLCNMSDDHVEIIESVGLELEIEEGLALSIIPCEYVDCGQ